MQKVRGSADGDSVRISDDFQTGVNPYWRVTQIGAGAVRHEPGRLGLMVNPTGADRYADAQISDYHEGDFRWRPPARLTVRAYAVPGAAALRGTAGFGFWNQPFMPGQRRLRLPQAAWFFFSSPPSRMQLARGVAGPGWKAATIDARRWAFLALLPAAPVGVLLMRLPALYARLWPLGQRAIGVSEALLGDDLLAQPHTYTLDWQRDGVSFSVDARAVHHAPTAPGGPLGFIAWLDTQYAVVTPQGQFAFGLLPVDQPQSLVLEAVTIEGQPS
jgi:hypothetical protein